MYILSLLSHVEHLYGKSCKCVCDVHKGDENRRERERSLRVNVWAFLLFCSFSWRALSSTYKFLYVAHFFTHSHSHESMRAVIIFARDTKGEKLSNWVNKIENHVRICQIHTGNADFFPLSRIGLHFKFDDFLWHSKRNFLCQLIFFGAKL